MKFSLAALTALFTLSSALPEIAVDSPMGRSLMQHARQVAENQDYDWEAATAWVTGYSVKFQGCNSIKQWNSNAEGDEDVKISTKNLVRFRLCPSTSCSATKAAGCTSGYGDYIVDMDVFLQAYIQGKAQQIEWDCQNQLANSCDCNDDDGKGDDFNAETCEYDCFNNAGMTQCIDRNPYEEDNGEQQQEQEQFNIEEWMQCGEVKVQNNNGRALAENNGEVKYYVGPYCASQGGAILLGLFTDDTCTEAASGVNYRELTGYDLPYNGTDKSIVDMQCLSCMESQDVNEQNANDQADADSVNEMCEQLYTYAGKCEANYPSGMVTTANNNACNYMEAIRIVRQDGIIDTASARPSAVATAFIVIFAMAFAAMAFYVWYLRTRLGVKKNTLL